MTASAPPTLRLTPTGTQHLLHATLQDCITGLLIGSALGDAIGLYTEFLSAQASRTSYPAGTFTLAPASQATPFRRDHHRAPHLTGEWTDDTDHALLILLSYLHGRAHGQADPDPADFARRLSIWVRNGLRALDTLPLGLGRTVGRIVRSGTFLDDAEGTAYGVWVGGGRNVAPNGSLMRTHPLGVMCLGKSREETFGVAGRFSVVTHVDPRCVVSCAIGTELLRGLVAGEYSTETDVDTVIDAAVAWYGGWAAEKHTKLEREGEVPGLDVEELDRHVRGDKVKELGQLQLDDGQKMGYVYKCLGSGILILRLAMRRLAESNRPMAVQMVLFEELITDLTYEGGDADTNAVFAGALLGALLGYRAIPTHRRDGLRHGEWLMDKSEALCRVIGVSPGTYDGKEDKDTLPDGGRGLLSEHEMEGRWMMLQARIAKEETEYRRKKEAEEKKKVGFLKFLSSNK